MSCFKFIISYLSLVTQDWCNFIQEWHYFIQEWRYFKQRTMLFHKNPGGKPPEGPGRRPLLCGPGIWLMSGRGPYGSKRGRGSPVPGVGLIPPGMNGKLGNRSLWPPEIKKWWTGHVTILTEESISHITILQSNSQVLFIMCRAKCRAAHTLWASKLQKSNCANVSWWTQFIVPLRGVKKGV